MGDEGLKGRRKEGGKDYVREVRNRLRKGERVQGGLGTFSAIVDEMTSKGRRVITAIIILITIATIILIMIILMRMMIMRRTRIIG
jgi:hypothetical protein